MISHLIRVATLAACLSVPALAQAQEADSFKAAFKAWGHHQGTDPKECWAVSVPKEQVNTKDGRVVAVRRGETLLFVFFRPTANVKGQVTFTGGYPFAAGSTVSLDIDGKSYTMITDGEWAWPATPNDDAKIVTSMKRGATATLTGRSGRGTVTKDVFSLSGFTAAHDAAEKDCS